MLQRIYWFIFDLFQGKTTLLGGLRSNKWASVRAEHLKKFPACAICNKQSSLLNPLNVHHCIPFNVDKSLELNPENLITLCRKDHLLFGHLNNFKSWNTEVRPDSKVWHDKIKNRPTKE